jgi:hypothetical protein
MRGADLEAREAVERPFKDQMRQGDRGFEGVANGVRQEPTSGQAATRFQFAGAERVHEDEHPQRFAGGPERVEFRMGEFLTSDAAGHADTAEAKRLDRVLNLFGGEVRILHGRGRKATNRSGCAAQKAARASFWTRMTSVTASRSARYQ